MTSVFSSPSALHTLPLRVEYPATKGHGTLYYLQAMGAYDVISSDLHDLEAKLFTWALNEGYEIK